MNNENDNRTLLRESCLKSAPSSNRRCMLLFLIFTIITTMPLIITSKVDNNTNSNNVANALTQKNVKLTSNINNSKATTKAATPSSISLPLSRGYVNGKIASLL